MTLKDHESIGFTLNVVFIRKLRPEGSPPTLGDFFAYMHEKYPDLCFGWRLDGDGGAPGSLTVLVE